MDEAWALPSQGELRARDREQRYGGPGRHLEHGVRSKDLVDRRPRPPAFKCLLVGVMVTLLYVWPLEFLAYLFADGFSQAIFRAVLGGSVVVVTVATWILTAREMRRWGEHWEQNWHKLSDFATPAPWR
jgi:hypothetical protein